MNQIIVRLLIVATSVSSLAGVFGCGDGGKGDINYAALGASDTFGIGATPLTNGYPYLIEEGLEARTGKKVDLDNLGIPGAEIGEIDNLEVPILRASSSDLVTLSTGANDLIDGDNPERFESDLNGLINKIRSASTNAVIVISNIPDLTKLERFIERPDANVTSDRVALFNAAISRQARSHGLVLVDLFSVPLSDSLVSEADGFHPNDRGHRVMADSFLTAIEPFLGTLSSAAE